MLRIPVSLPGVSGSYLQIWGEKLISGQKPNSSSSGAENVPSHNIALFANESSRPRRYWKTLRLPISSNTLPLYQLTIARRSFLLYYLYLLLGILTAVTDTTVAAVVSAVVVTATVTVFIILHEVCLKKASEEIASEITGNHRCRQPHCRLTPTPREPPRISA